jgi:WD40 repeat protein
MHEPEHPDNSAQEAEGKPSAPTRARTSASGSSRLGRRRTAIIVGGVVLAGIIIAASLNLSSWLRGPTGPQVRPPVPLALYRDAQACGGLFGSACDVTQFVCPRQPRWSPDGTRIAILSSCAQGDATSNKLYLYDASTGGIIRTIVLDFVILGAPNVPVPPPSGAATPSPGTPGYPCLSEPVVWVPVLRTLAVLWSPDGQRLVVPFTYTFATQDEVQGPACPTWGGVLLIDPDGGNTHVLLEAIPAADNACYAEWDLQHGSLVSGRRDASTAFSCLPPALGYRWGADGVLVPVQSLAGTQAPPTPACDPPGNPDGGAEFTIWQNGEVQLTNRLSSPTFHIPGAFSWNTAFTAWSPDSRYLTSLVYVQGLLEPAGQPVASQSTLVDLGLGQAPLLPIHDQAIQKVAAQLVTAASPLSDYQRTYVAWRPDGHVLAALGPYGERPSLRLTPQRVDLYDCASGRRLASLVPLSDRQHTAVYYAETLLSWSPDGRHLLLISGALGTGTIWGPAQLGAIGE